jgi:hypothetical protein
MTGTSATSPWCHERGDQDVYAKLICVSCGAEANASCNCGVDYKPKSVRAAEAIRADPGKSDRAIAADIGADRKQVRRERAKLGGDMSPPERIGRNGKSYPAKPKRPVSAEKNISIVEFDRLIYKIIRKTKNADPERFGAKTAMSPDDLRGLADFISGLLAAREAALANDALLKIKEPGANGADAQRPV